MPDLNTNEKQSNLGYCALKKESTKGTAVQPDTFIPLYSEDVAINLNIDEDNPIVGVRAARYDVFRGMEDYGGSMRFRAEPKTLPHLLNMILKKGSSSGDATTGYTHPYTLGAVDAYTLEFLKGNIPFRFYGVEIHGMRPAFEDNKMVMEVDISARGQFSVAKLTSASSTTVVLDDSERGDPTDALTTDDSLRLYDVDGGTYEDVTITSINADGKTLTVSTISGTYTAGDLCWLAPLTASFTLGEPFNWAKSEFRFAADAATALSASQTRVEAGSGWDLSHAVEDEAGAKRSGNFRPAGFVRTQGDIEVSVKKFFSDGQEQDRFLQKSGRALVIRHYSLSEAGTNGTLAELRVTINEYYIRENPVNLAQGEILYNDMVLVPVYSSGDSQMLDIKVVNSLAGSDYN